MSAVARVTPIATARAVRGPFDYRLDEDADGVRVGTLLRVPFAGRRLLGVVVELADRSELAPERLAVPDAVLGPGIPEDLVELALWMSVEYCSTPARALSLMLPPGSARGVGARKALVAELTPAGKEALADADIAVSDAQRELLERLGERGPARAAQLGTSALRRLERRGLVSIDRRAVRRTPTLRAVGARAAHAPPLTAGQEMVLPELLDSIRAGEPDGLLLHGVTGSGKTELYLQAVQAVLEQGRDAIVLVPEIGLTPQAVGRFQARFGDVVAILHSALGEGERHDEWARLRAGEARVCVGPRSAVFAPLRDVGLIVVDEEHDGSYKHDSDPRYDARAVAAWRARRNAAVLLCGSATPRPESVHALRRLRLEQRIDGRPLPPVEVLDMRGCHHPLHPATRMALADVRRVGGKAIVLLNRRGWSNFLSCRACGCVWSCPNCDVALVLHGSSSAGAATAAVAQPFVACHHCGHREPVPSRCGSCASAAVGRHGSGTERLEHELRDALGDPGFPIFRLDADVARSHAAAVLGRFEAARAGALVGTQMVAKGHDFPDVMLAVVLDADQTLRFPDFRAEERTFALVTQLAGRAGRGGDGRVLVQTLAPEARPISHAARHDADGFLCGELERRRALAYPPFGSLIRVVCAAPEEPEVAAVAADLRELISVPDAGVVLGPAPLFRLRGKARRQLLVKATERAAAIAAVGAAVDRVAASASRRTVSISVDVDPQ